MIPTATLVALLQALLSFVQDAPEIIQAAETAIGILQSGQPITAEQQAQIDAALDAANTKLQSS